MFLKYLSAAAALLTTSGASAAIYSPSFAGPGLDPNVTFTGDPGISYSVGFGSLGIYKAGGLFSAYSTVKFSYKIPTSSDFDAQLTVSNLKNAGLLYSLFNVRYDTGGDYGTIFTDSFFRPPSGEVNYTAFTGNFNTFGSIDLSDDIVVLQFRHSGEYIEALVNGNLLNRTNDYIFPNRNFVFSFDVVSSVLYTEPADRAVFIQNFVLTTPDLCSPIAPCTGGVPEPANWALLIAGFGLTGAAMRRRRVVAA